MKNPTRTFCALLVTLLLQFGGFGVAEASETAIERQIQKIKETYGVQVHYMYRPEEYFSSRWLKPPISARGEQLSNKEVKRLLPLIESFLSSYPKSVLDKNLENIYLLSELFFYGKSFGATNNKSSLYIKSMGERKGFTNSFLLSRMFSEFSSILMRNYEFPEKEWQKINPANFKYLGSGVEMLGTEGLYGQDNKLLSMGFIVKYSQSSMENDFNMVSDWLFSQPGLLNKLAKKHKKIRMKMELAVKFYKSIDEGFEFR